jgi:hypothetical protein
MTGADGFLGWEAPGDCARELFGAGRELPRLNPGTPYSLVLPEWPVATMNPSGR